VTEGISVWWFAATTGADNVVRGGFNNLKRGIWHNLPRR